MSKTKTRPTASPPSPLAGWQARSVHTITCSTGQRIRIRIPGIATILEEGDLAENLIDVALLELTAKRGALGSVADDAENGGDEEKARALTKIRDYGALQRHLAKRAVVAVESPDGWTDVTLTDEDLADLPVEDVVMVAEIVMRLRGTDARGVTIGVEPLSRWEMFREAHGCAAEGCEACAQVFRAFSSVDVGEV